MRTGGARGAARDLHEPGAKELFVHVLSPQLRRGHGGVPLFAQRVRGKSDRDEPPALKEVRIIQLRKQLVCTHTLRHMVGWVKGIRQTKQPD